MFPDYELAAVKLIHGDCVEVMRGMDEASVDAVVCDPPYNLGFMSKPWDIQHDHEPWAREALRVLKPGGHLLAFGGTRTYHRLACAIEDAGFEIRDSLMWLYGSGFPKSLDVGKAIDKRGGANIGWFGPWLRKERERRGITAKALCEAIGEHGAVNHGGAVSNWERGHNLPTADQFNKLCEALGLNFERIEEAEREVVGSNTKARSKDGKSALPTMGAGVKYESWDLTAPATPEAQQWNGWGTALKPAHEPIVLARKPLTGTVAQNCLEHGTGALNVDGCRVGSPDIAGKVWTRGGNQRGASLTTNTSGKHEYVEANPSGRWPANLVLSHSPGCDEACAPGCPVAELDGQSGELHTHAGRGEYGDFAEKNCYGDGWTRRVNQGKDSGGASRFFYVAKASRRERNAGLEGFEQTNVNDGRATAIDNPYQRGDTLRHNTHPTVKPIELMRWLCRLVTPPGGTILDPFLGSGTTGCAAVLEGFDFIGIEKEAEYLKIAEARIAHWKKQAVQLELAA